MTSDPALSQQEPPPEAPRINRRTAVHYRCGSATLGRLAAVGRHETLSALVLDLSGRGIGLLVSRPLEPGTPVVIQLKSPALEGSLELPARVVHATPPG
jgi:hypothetical protein